MQRGELKESLQRQKTDERMALKLTDTKTDGQEGRKGRCKTLKTNAWKRSQEKCELLRNSEITRHAQQYRVRLGKIRTILFLLIVVFHYLVVL